MSYKNILSKEVINDYQPIVDDNKLLDSGESIIKSYLLDLINDWEEVIKYSKGKVDVSVSGRFHYIKVDNYSLMFGREDDAIKVVRKIDDNQTVIDYITPNEDKTKCWGRDKSILDSGLIDSYVKKAFDEIISFD